MHFFALKQNTAGSAGSRRLTQAWASHSGPGRAARAEPCIAGPAAQAEPRGPDAVFPSVRRPVPTARGRAGFEHKLGAKLRPYLTFARLWPFLSLPSTTLDPLGPGCPFLISSPPSRKNTLTVVSRFGKSMALPFSTPRWEGSVTALEWPLTVDSRTALAAFLKTRS